MREIRATLYDIYCYFFYFYHIRHYKCAIYNKNIQKPQNTTDRKLRREREEEIGEKMWSQRPAALKIKAIENLWHGRLLLPSM